MDFIGCFKKGRQQVLITTSDQRNILFKGMAWDAIESKYNSPKYRILHIDVDYDVLVIKIDEYRTPLEKQYVVYTNRLLSNVYSEYTLLRIFDAKGKDLFYDAARLYKNNYSLCLEPYVVKSIEAENGYLKLTTYKELS